MLNHLLISRCDGGCDWNGPSVVLTPDQATQKLVVKSSQHIACFIKKVWPFLVEKMGSPIECDSDILLIERMDANWLRKFDNLISCVF